MKISIVGAGYVGLSLAILISKKYKVNLIDIDAEKINKIKNKVSPIKDNYIKRILANKKLKLYPSTDFRNAYTESNFIIIATPTDYNENKKSFDTKSVEKTISKVREISENTQIVIKSTIPIGFTNRMRRRYSTKNIFYSPEFLREGRALQDNMYPSRIVVGDTTKEAKKFGKILLNCSKYANKENILHFMHSSEAESVKLFSNTYLAMRVSFFNEMDTFAVNNNLSTKQIIAGVCSDPRIGDYYNNPSFGYGGYCLPKDTKQLQSNFKNLPNSLISATIDSNQVRKDFIVKSILKKKPKLIGIYRLIMKKESDNFRQSAIFDIIKGLKSHGVKMIMFEPELKEPIMNIELINDFKKFTLFSDVILANRISKELEIFSSKVYSRDIFNEN